MCNFGGRSYSYDSSTIAGSNTLGLVQRDLQTTGSTSNTLSCFFYQNASKTISRPTESSFTIKIYNNFLTNTLLFDTGTSPALAVDMTSWTMMIEFIPLEESLNCKAL